MSILNAINPLISQAADRLAQASIGSGAAGGTSTAGSNQLTPESFIKLLTAQLQTQDPLNPVDPTTFVTQLVQFNQLEQLMQINSTLSGAATAGSGSNAPTSNAPPPSAAAQSKTAPVA